MRRQHIRVEYSVSWFGAAITLLAGRAGSGLWSGWPRRSGSILRRWALLTVVGCLFVIVIFRFSVVISGLKDSNIALTQRIAVLEYRIESAHEQSKT